MSDDLVRYEMVEVIEETALDRQSVRQRVEDAQQRAHFGQALLQAKLADDEWMAVQWSNLHEDWLRFVQSQHSGSPATERNYRLATRQWREFVATLRHDLGPEAGYPVKLWQVDARHVRQWTMALQDVGNGDATINLKLSAVSSFYSYVINEKRMVGGVEACLFTDVLGQQRSNPFKYGNIQRPKGGGESQRARPLSPQELGATFRILQDKQQSLSGARNYALMLAYTETGFRNAEVRRMQWKHLRPSKSQRERIIYAWVGKGGKKEDEPVPEIVWHAIVHYLTLDGRWLPNAPLHEQPLQPDDFIFRPTRTHEMKGMRNQPEIDPEGSISEKAVIRVLRTALRAAGVENADSIRIHDLRHTWALRMLAEGAHESEIKLRAHHSSLETTAHYLSGLRNKGRDRKDLRSGRLAVQLRAFADGDAPDSWAEIIEAG